MSINLHLRATAKAILYLNNSTEEKEMVEYFDLRQTPTKITERAINSGEPLKVYLDMLRSFEPEATEILGIVDNGLFGKEYYYEDEYRDNTDERSIPWEDLEKVEWEDLEKVEQLTQRVIHEKELEQWLKEHEGWDIEWFAM